MKALLLITVGWGGFFIAVGSTFAQTWTQATASNLNWCSIASSADGSKLVAAGSDSLGFVSIYTSADSGASWNLQTNRLGALSDSIAPSADGTKLFAATYGAGQAPSVVYVSTNSGATWVQRFPASSDLGYASIAASADGNTLVYATEAGLGVFISTNSGTTWELATNASNLSGRQWVGVRCSADGTKMAVEGGVGGNTVRLLTSTNSGSSWQMSFSAPGAFGWASSADGSKLFVWGSDLYVSTNWGATWSTNFIGWGGALAGVGNGFNGGLACSADGSKSVAVLSGGIIKTSPDSGMTWVTNSAPVEEYDYAASSADGSKSVAVSQNQYPPPYVGGVWVSQSVPMPQLNLASSSNGLAFSWIVPSTNFVLQENSNLTTTNWVTLTNTPALNLSYLNNEVVLSPSNSSGFFRLMSQ
ncbi:MAG TPA: hypothetical protein VG077_14795 [Verrucomicrobiae bacterium]|nr:hypothetical protein [Verrucomicrobiae bacterium]